MHCFACFEGRRCFRGDLSCPQVNGFMYAEAKSRCRSGVDGTSLIKPRLHVTLFLAESRERSSRDGLTYGSLIDYESQKIKRQCSTVAELYSFMKCFGSFQFLRGLWMDISGEVANIHMRTDAKNLVTTTRRIHLPEQKKTIHMIFMLRKEACSGSIYDLAHIPTRYSLTKASAKANNLITALKNSEIVRC